MMHKGKQRPDTRNKIPRGVLFHDTGSSGWGRVRTLGDYKGERSPNPRSEKDFGDQHDRFWGPGDEPA